MEGDTRVCPFCGHPPGPGVFCEACGRNLAGIEQLPTAREFERPDLESALREFLDAKPQAGTKELPCAEPRSFRRTPKLTGWIVLPVDREDFEKPKRYVPGLFLSVDGTFHQLDSELRGWGQRDFPRYEHRVAAEAVEPRPDQEPLIVAALTALRAA
jgi:hypothetical protein